MKIVKALLSSLAVANHASSTKLFATKSCQAISSAASKNSPDNGSSAIFNVRGGDLGSLTSDAAAKTLVGYAAVNGWTIWLATEGVLKSWGMGAPTPSDKVTFVFRIMGSNMFAHSVALVALLRGASVGSALGLLSLLWVGGMVNMLIDDMPSKYGTNSAGFYTTLTLSALAAYGNLLDQYWTGVVNKVIAVWVIFNGVVAAALPDKFKEAWKFGEDDGGAISDLAANNFGWSIVGNAALLYALVFMEESAAKVVGLSNIPFLIPTVYNAFFSKAADEVFEQTPRFIFAAIVAVLVAAILL